MTTSPGWRPAEMATDDGGRAADHVTVSSNFAAATLLHVALIKATALMPSTPSTLCFGTLSIGELHVNRGEGLRLCPVARAIRYMVQAEPQ